MLKIKNFDLFADGKEDWMAHEGGSEAPPPPLAAETRTEATNTDDDLNQGNHKLTAYFYLL